MKEGRQRPPIVRFHLYDLSRTDKSTETGSRLAVVGAEDGNQE